MLQEVTIAGLRVTKERKSAVLQELTRRLDQNVPTTIITPYSEFLHRALVDREVMTMLNKATLSIPDGVGMLWAHTYLAKPLTLNSALLAYGQAILQMVSSGAQIILNPKSIYKTIPEKIVGADFFWDLVALAEQRGEGIYLLGGYGDTNKTVQRIVQTRYPKIHIAGASTDDYPGTSQLVQDIANSSAKFLFVAWGPIRQERWIIDTIPKMPNIKVAIGLGATFDYVAGTKKAPPKLIRKLGIEWLFRLFTQPYRYKRIYNATIGLICLLVQYKLGNKR